MWPWQVPVVSEKTCCLLLKDTGQNLVLHPYLPTKEAANSALTLYCLSIQNLRGRGRGGGEEMASDLHHSCVQEASSLHRPYAQRGLLRFLSPPELSPEST